MGEKDHMILPALEFDELREIGAVERYNHIIADY